VETLLATIPGDFFWEKQGVRRVLLPLTLTQKGFLKLGKKVKGKMELC
jgi:hypothetical protein